MTSLQAFDSLMQLWPTPANWDRSLITERACWLGMSRVTYFPQGRELYAETPAAWLEQARLLAPRLQPPFGPGERLDYKGLTDWYPTHLPELPVQPWPVSPFAREEWDQAAQAADLSPQTALWLLAADPLKGLAFPLEETLAQLRLQFPRNPLVLLAGALPQRQPLYGDLWGLQGLLAPAQAGWLLAEETKHPPELAPATSAPTESAANAWRPWRRQHRRAYLLQSALLGAGIELQAPYNTVLWTQFEAGPDSPLGKSVLDALAAFRLHRSGLNTTQLPTYRIPHTGFELMAERRILAALEQEPAGA